MYFPPFSRIPGVRLQPLGHLSQEGVLSLSAESTRLLGTNCQRPKRLLELKLAQPGSRGETYKARNCFWGGSRRGRRDGLDFRCSSGMSGSSGNGRDNSGSADTRILRRAIGSPSL